MVKGCTTAKQSAAKMTLERWGELWVDTYSNRLGFSAGFRAYQANCNNARVQHQH